jgi:hypothetical protein
MARVETLCVVTSIILLAAGISTPYLLLNTGWSVNLGNIQFALSWETLYGVAALFCLFACLYSIGYLPFDKSVIQWHLWLSRGCVVSCVIGQVVFYLALRRELGLNSG